VRGKVLCAPFRSGLIQSACVLFGIRQQKPYPKTTLHLNVCVHDDELDSLHSVLDHAKHCVGAPSADADDFDDARRELNCAVSHQGDSTLPHRPNGGGSHL
jgi:hypothetical protein